eukprot:scaffold309177_cov15-Tisochrysis_lutea.AAC.1
MEFSSLPHCVKFTLQVCNNDIDNTTAKGMGSVGGLDLMSQGAPLGSFFTFFRNKAFLTSLQKPGAQVKCDADKRDAFQLGLILKLIPDGNANCGCSPLVLGICVPKFIQKSQCCLRFGEVHMLPATASIPQQLTALQAALALLTIPNSWEPIRTLLCPFPELIYGMLVQAGDGLQFKFLEVPAEDDHVLGMAGFNLEDHAEFLGGEFDCGTVPRDSIAGAPETVNSAAT